MRGFEFDGGLPSSAKYPGSASSAAREESSPATYGMSSTRCGENTPLQRGKTSQYFITQFSQSTTQTTKAKQSQSFIFVKILNLIKNQQG